MQGKILQEYFFVEKNVTVYSSIQAHPSYFYKLITATIIKFFTLEEQEFKRLDKTALIFLTALLP
jgi:hypothetical protein